MNEQPTQEPRTIGDQHHNEDFLPAVSKSGRPDARGNIPQNAHFRES